MSEGEARPVSEHERDLAGLKAECGDAGLARGFFVLIMLGVTLFVVYWLMRSLQWVGGTRAFAWVLGVAAAAGYGMLRLILDHPLFMVALFVSTLITFIYSYELPPWLEILLTITFLLAFASGANYFIGGIN